MRTTKQTSLVLVIVITTAAIMAAAATTSLGAAKPAFAKVNCNEDITICTGSANAQTQQTCKFQTICRGGSGGQSTLVPGSEQTISGGGGGQSGPFSEGTLVGGSGEHRTCVFSPLRCNTVGGSGQHIK